MPPFDPPPAQIYAVALGDYRRPDQNPPLDADTEAAALTLTLQDLLDSEAATWRVPAEERDAGAVLERLDTWAEATDRAGSVLVWLGHGTSAPDRAALIVPGKPGATRDTALEPGALADRIRDEYARRHHDPTQWAIILIEACGAARFVQLVASRLLQQGDVRGVLLVGAGETLGRTTLGTVRAALTQILDRNYTVNDTRIPLSSLAALLTEQIPGAIQPIELRGCALTRTAPIVTAPLDVYAALEQALQSLPAAERGHYARKGMGADFGELTWNFVGRQKELSELSTWLAKHDHGMLVVTGKAGTGKSALLGNLLLRDRPAVRDLLHRSGLLPEPASDDAQQTHFDLCLHLTGTTVDDVAVAIASAASVRYVSSAGSTLHGVISKLVGALDGHPGMTVLADALDEAVDPVGVAELLSALADLPNTRLIVGTRASTQEGPDQPTPTDTDIQDALSGTSGRHQTLTVNRDQTALDDYVRQQLADLPASRVDDVATRIAGDPRHEFLFARLAIRELRADPQLLEPGERARLNALLAGDHRTVFAAAVGRMARSAPTAAAFLRALTFAQGRGLPRADRIWFTAAQALADSVLTDDELAGALDLAAPYIMLDSAERQSVYRLAHRTFDEHYSSYVTHAEGARLVAAALLGEAARVSPAIELNPYFVTHLAGHIAHLGEHGWRRLAANPELLDRLDPRAVAAEAFHRSPTPVLPPAIRGVILAADQLARAAPGDRPGQRELAMARLGRMPVEAYTPNAESPWSVVSAARLPSTLHRILAENVAPTSVAALSTPDGRPLLAVGGDDGTVRLWDPASSRLYGTPLVGPMRPISSMTVFMGPDGRSLLAVGSDDGTVRLWDPAIGRPFGSPLVGHPGPVEAVAAFTGRDGRSMLVTGGRDGVRRWDPISGRQVGALMAGNARRAHALIVFPGSDDRPLLVTSGGDGTVQVWDPINGRPIGAPLISDIRPVWALAVFPGLDGRPLLATGGGDGMIRLWDPGSGRPAALPLIGHTDAVWALAVFPRPDGRPVLASAGSDGTMRLWDPDSGRPVGAPLTAHTAWVQALAVFPGPDGRPLLASGSVDGTVRLWDPDTSRLVRTPLTSHTDSVRVLAVFPRLDGRSMLVSGGSDGTVRLWDPDTADLVGKPLTDRTGWILAAAVFSGRNGLPLLATGGDDGLVRLWDPGAGVRIGEPLTGHAGWVLAIAVFTGKDGRPLLATGGDDGAVRLWDPAEGKPAGPPLAGHRRGVNAVTAFTGSGGRTLLATGSDDGTVRLWDPIASRPVGMPMAGHRGPVRVVTVFAGPDGSPVLATGGDDGAVRLWDPDTGVRVGRHLTGHTECVYAITAFSGPNGRTVLATGGNDEVVRIWDWQRSTPLAEIRLSGLTIHAIAVLDGDLLVGLPDGWCRLRLSPTILA